MFNKGLFMYLIYLDGALKPNVVDCDTDFSLASLAPNMYTITVQDTFVMIWVNVYTAYLEPFHVHMHQDYALNSVKWVQL